MFTSVRRGNDRRGGESLALLLDDSEVAGGGNESSAHSHMVVRTMAEQPQSCRVLAEFEEV